MTPHRIVSITSMIALLCTAAPGQDTERPRPESWDDLVPGGRFMDRFLPVPVRGELTTETWGQEGVRPRDISNGIEERAWSYWGGNILRGDDGKYHLFVCRWPESAEKGHMAWPQSEVVRAVSDDLIGPYTFAQQIGQGHNPEVFRLKDGRYVLYVMGGRYLADNLEGPWERGTFTFDPRDRRIIEGLSNLSFAPREDGSVLMVCRGGGIWVSEDGLSPYHQVTCKRVYPDVEGAFEDPVIWRTRIQYHMIVNDWHGRIAYYLRSKNGIDWKVEPGEAYMPGIDVYQNGTVVDWYKYERIKIFQDEYGRAIQANFAVIDYSKWEDKAKDNHSSKNISIPLAAGRLLTLLDEEEITPATEEIRVRIKAEEDFDPHRDIDLASLRFGASEEVNFGRGATVLRTEALGRDLILVFGGQGHGIGVRHFAAKVLGRTRDDDLLFGYARLPWQDDMEPILSARVPVRTGKGEGSTLRVEITNFGQVASEEALVETVFVDAEGKTALAASGRISPLEPYASEQVELRPSGSPGSGDEHTCTVSIRAPEGRLLRRETFTLLSS